MAAVLSLLLIRSPLPVGRRGRLYSRHHPARRDQFNFAGNQRLSAWLVSDQRCSYLVHLSFGIWGLLAYRTYAAARTYARWIAIISGIFTVMGLLPTVSTTLGLIHCSAMTSGYTRSKQSSLSISAISLSHNRKSLMAAANPPIEPTFTLGHSVGMQRSGCFRWWAFLPSRKAPLTWRLTFNTAFGRGLYRFAGVGAATRNLWPLDAARVVRPDLTFTVIVLGVSIIILTALRTAVDAVLVCPVYRYSSECRLSSGCMASCRQLQPSRSRRGCGWRCKFQTSIVGPYGVPC